MPPCVQPRPSDGANAARRAPPRTSAAATAPSAAPGRAARKRTETTPTIGMINAAQRSVVVSWPRRRSAAAAGCCEERGRGARGDVRQEQRREPGASRAICGGFRGVCDTHCSAGEVSREQVLGARAPAQRALAAGRREDAPGVDAFTPPATRRGASEAEHAATSADGGSCVAANASDTPVAHAEARSVGST